MTMTKKAFNLYVLSFYGPNGVYPMGANLRQVQRATNTLIKEHFPVEFDSVDREHVRDILVRDFGLTFPIAGCRGGLDL